MIPLQRRVDRLQRRAARMPCSACGCFDGQERRLALEWCEDADAGESERCPACGAMLVLALSFDSREP